MQQYATAKAADPDLHLKREAAVVAAVRWGEVKTEDDRLEGLWPREEHRLRCLRNVP